MMTQTKCTESTVDCPIFMMKHRFGINCFALALACCMILPARAQFSLATNAVVFNFTTLGLNPANINSVTVQSLAPASTAQSYYASYYTNFNVANWPQITNGAVVCGPLVYGLGVTYQIQLSDGYQVAVTNFCIPATASFDVNGRTPANQWVGSGVSPGFAWSTPWVTNYNVSVTVTGAVTSVTSSNGSVAINSTTNGGAVNYDLSAQGGGGTNGGTPIGATATISLSTNGGVVYPSVVSAPALTGSQSNLVASAVQPGTAPVLNGANVTNVPAASLTGTVALGQLPPSVVAGSTLLPPVNALPVLWLTGNSLTTNAAGAYVSTWYDSSGNGNNAVATGNNQIYQSDVFPSLTSTAGLNGPAPWAMCVTNFFKNYPMLNTGGVISVVFRNNTYNTNADPILLGAGIGGINDPFQVQAYRPDSKVGGGVTLCPIPDGSKLAWAVSDGTLKYTCVSWRYDGTYIDVWQDGQCVLRNEIQGTYTGSANSLGATNSLYVFNVASSGNYPAPNNIADVKIYTNVLNDSQMNVLSQFDARNYGKLNREIAVAGDSVFQGVIGAGLPTTFPRAIASQVQQFDVVVHAVGGRNSSNEVQNIPTWAGQRRNQSGVSIAIDDFGLINDGFVSQGNFVPLTVAQANTQLPISESNVITACAMLHSNGWVIGMGTLLSYYGETNGWVTNVNTWITGPGATNYDFFMPFNAVAGLSTNGAFSNSLWFADAPLGLHPSGLFGQPYMSTQAVQAITAYLGIPFQSQTFGTFKGSFFGNGGGITNLASSSTNLTLGSSVTGNNSATASWMLGVDGSGKVTTNAVPISGSSASSNNFVGQMNTNQIYPPAAALNLLGSAAFSATSAFDAAGAATTAASNATNKMYSTPGMVTNGAGFWAAAPAGSGGGNASTNVSQYWPAAQQITNASSTFSGSVAAATGYPWSSLVSPPAGVIITSTPAIKLSFISTNATANGSNVTMQIDVNGASVSNLNAANISSGTLSDSRLSPDVVLQYSSIPYTNVAGLLVVGSIANAATIGMWDANETLNQLTASGNALLWNGDRVVTNNQTGVTLSGTFSGNLAIGVPSGAANGYVFTLTNSATGQGTWSNAPAGGGSAPNGAITNNTATQIFSGPQALTNQGNTIAGNGNGLTNLPWLPAYSFHCDSGTFGTAAAADYFPLAGWSTGNASYKRDLTCLAAGTYGMVRIELYPGQTIAPTTNIVFTLCTNQFGVAPVASGIVLTFSGPLSSSIDNYSTNFSNTFTVPEGCYGTWVITNNTSAGLSGQYLSISLDRHN